MPSQEEREQSALQQSIIRDAFRNAEEAQKEDPPPPQPETIVALQAQIASLKLDILERDTELAEQRGQIKALLVSGPAPTPQKPEPSKSDILADLEAKITAMNRIANEEKAKLAAITYELNYSFDGNRELPLLDECYGSSLYSEWAETGIAPQPTWEMLSSLERGRYMRLAVHIARTTLIADAAERSKRLDNEYLVGSNLSALTHRSRHKEATSEICRLLEDIQRWKWLTKAETPQEAGEMVRHSEDDIRHYRNKVEELEKELVNIRGHGGGRLDL